jgi:hypothetical protein
MQLKRILYQESISTIQFCSYSINQQEHKGTPVYFLQYTKGQLGEFNESDCFISENEKEIAEFVNELEIEFTDKIITQQTVEIKISIDLKFLSQKNIPESELIRWIHRAVEHACFNSGLGVITEVESKVNTNNSVITFSLELNILYHQKLVTVLQELMAPWGIDFSESKNSITISLR